jgi:sugar-specific transcriptional regulator TrmB
MDNDIIIKYLEQLDLSEIEAKIYLSLLESGPTNVRELAESVGIKRTTAYTYIDELTEKGLVTEVVVGFHKQLAANQPQRLQYLIEKKLETAVNLQKTFPSILKTIGTTPHPVVEKNEADIKYYKGKNGVMTIYEEALKAHELRSYVNLAEMGGVFPENITLFANAFKNNKKLKIYELIEDSQTAREDIKIFTKSTRYSYKFIPHEVEITSADILIYDGKVGIINVRDTVSGIILHNVDYYNISKSLFDFMWKMLPLEKGFNNSNK